MGIALTRDQVIALAPDAASAKAATGLVSDSKWVSLGADAGAVWGECQGSGSKPYQAQVDLAELVSRCSCPSRKFPCKHGLALMLLYAQGNPRFAGPARPQWVDEWLNSRREKAAKKEQTTEAAATKAVVDPDAAAAATAKREAARWKRIETGTAELQRWIADQFRRGLAKFGPEQRADWAAMAARMVDAQAPGLAPLLQDAMEAMAAGASHYSRVIERLGLLQLLNEGVHRRMQLSPARLVDVRTALGWSVDKEEVLRDGEAVTDLWRVLGQCALDVDGKLSERRIWLQGLKTQRYALLQEFAYGGKGWDGAWLDNRFYEATLRYFPGSVPLRAVAQDAVLDSSSSVWMSSTNEAALDSVSHAFANNPWLAQLPMMLIEATPVRHDQAWKLHTDLGSFKLRTDDASAWSLLAFSGGHPLRLMGEWDGHELRPLGAWSDQAGYWGMAGVWA